MAAPVSGGKFRMLRMPRGTRLDEARRAAYRGTRGAGYADFPLAGFRPRRSANITPDPETGAGNWTDDMLARAIREGIGHDGRALFPFMPYPDMRHISDEDLASVIVYLRSIPPIRKALPDRDSSGEVPHAQYASAHHEPYLNPMSHASEARRVSGDHRRLTDCTRRSKRPADSRLEFTVASFWKVGGQGASANITRPSGIPYYDEALFLNIIRTGYVKARRLTRLCPGAITGTSPTKT